LVVVWLLHEDQLLGSFQVQTMDIPLTLPQKEDLVVQHCVLYYEQGHAQKLVSLAVASFQRRLLVEEQKQQNLTHH